MLQQLISRLETVHRATTREEREAIYRFRYRVYFEEFGRELGSPDHDRRWVRDDDDEKPYTTLLYTGTPQRITGTVRLRHWGPGEVPHHDFEELSMDRIPGVERLGTAEIGRLMVRRSMRGKLVIPALLRKSYEILAGEQGTDLTCCYCSPGLVRYYQQLAMRPFGGRPVAAPDGIMLPLVAVMSDRAYYRRARSFLAPLVRRFFGPKKRPALDLEPLLPLFAPGRTGIEFEPHRVWSQVQGELLHKSCATTCPVLDLLPEDTLEELARQALIVDVPAGTLVTRAGFREPELFVVIEGRYHLDDHSTPLSRGHLFGEDALTAPEGRRRHSVHAETDGRLLMLRGRTLEKLLCRRPELKAPVMRHLEELARGRGVRRAA